MSRYIDAEWLLNFFEPYPNDYQTPLGSLRACVDDAPSIDIVRCKECKWRDHIGCALKIVDDSDKPKDDDFCSYGERERAVSDDLIRRSDAINALKSMLSDDINTSILFFWQNQTVGRGIDKIKNLPSADRPQGWIPCSERLPSNFGKDETVLATTDVDGRRVVLMLATDVERFYLKGYVSAWMPSPKPWKGTDDGE